MTTWLLTLATTTTLAADCEALARRATTTSGPGAVSAWVDLAKCDPAMAEARFADFMRSTKDVESLSALALAAIDAKVHKPLYTMLEQVTDYAARDEAARTVGESCEGHAVVPFLASAYASAKDRQFTSWQAVMNTCNDPAMTAWLKEVAAAPPTAMIADKYAAVLDAYRRKEHVDALPTLETAAMAAAKAGPFNAILVALTEAVRPEGLGSVVTDEGRKLLEDSLVRIAKGVDPTHAREVAERLYQSGAVAAAASLLPSVYPDRVQADGTLLYGVATLEACDGVGVVHHAVVHEPAKRWTVADDVVAPARASKPKLKCTSGEWPVVASTEPVLKAADVEAWATKLAAKWATEQKLTTSLKAEKDIVLP